MSDIVAVDEAQFLMIGALCRAAGQYRSLLLFRRLNVTIMKLNVEAMLSMTTMAMMLILFYDVDADDTIIGVSAGIVIVVNAKEDFDSDILQLVNFIWLTVQMEAANAVITFCREVTL